MRAQASLDMMLGTAVMLTMVAVLSLLAMGFSTDAMRLWAAQGTVNGLGKMADNLYGMGIGSGDVASVYVPDSVQAVTISGKVITLKLLTSTGNITVFYDTLATVNGSVYAAGGWQRIGLKVNGTGAVQINGLS